MHRAVSLSVDVSGSSTPNGIVSIQSESPGEKKVKKQDTAILVVGTEDSTCHVAASFLTMEGYNVVSMDGGFEALKALANATNPMSESDILCPFVNDDGDRVPVGVILLAMATANISGVEVMKALNKDPKTRSIPVISMTVSDSGHSDVVRKAFGEGAMAVLTAPIETHVLDQTVRAALTQSELRERLKNIEVKSFQLNSQNQRLENEVKKLKGEIEILSANSNANSASEAATTPKRRVLKRSNTMAVMKEEKDKEMTSLHSLTHDLRTDLNKSIRHAHTLNKELEEKNKQIEELNQRNTELARRLYTMTSSEQKYVAAVPLSPPVIPPTASVSSATVTGNTGVTSTGISKSGGKSESGRRRSDDEQASLDALSKSFETPIEQIARTAAVLSSLMGEGKTLIGSKSKSEGDVKRREKEKGRDKGKQIRFAIDGIDPSDDGGENEAVSAKDTYKYKETQGDGGNGDDNGDDEDEGGGGGNDSEDVAEGYGDIDIKGLHSLLVDSLRAMQNNTVYQPAFSKLFETTTLDAATKEWLVGEYSHENREMENRERPVSSASKSNVKAKTKEQVERQNQRSRDRLRRPSVFADRSPTVSSSGSSTTRTPPNLQIAVGAGGPSKHLGIGASASPPHSPIASTMTPTPKSKRSSSLAPSSAASMVPTTPSSTTTSTSTGTSASASASASSSTPMSAFGKSSISSVDFNDDTSFETVNVVSPTGSGSSFSLSPQLSPYVGDGTGDGTDGEGNLRRPLEKTRSVGFSNPHFYQQQKQLGGDGDGHDGHEDDDDDDYILIPGKHEDEDEEGAGVGGVTKITIETPPDSHKTFGHHRFHSRDDAFKSSVSLPMMNIWYSALDNWDFNPFQISDPKDFEPIVELMFDEFDLPSIFGIEKSVLRRFIHQVRMGYDDNRYHNFMHAFDVTQATFMMLSRTKLVDIITDPLDRLALLIAALTHDLEHHGTNNAFEKNIQSSLATTYNDASILENHSAACCFRLLRDPEIGGNILDGLSRDENDHVRKRVISCILATDMKNHFELVSKLNALKVNPLTNESEREIDLVCQLIIHVCDISNPCKPIPIARDWSARAVSEFFAQGDREKELGLPVSAGCDRTTITEPKVATNFIDFIVMPIVKSLQELIPELDPWVHNLRVNGLWWMRYAEDSSIPVDIEAAFPTSYTSLLDHDQDSNKDKEKEGEGEGKGEGGEGKDEKGESTVNDDDGVENGREKSQNQNGKEKEKEKGGYSTPRIDLNLSFNPQATSDDRGVFASQLGSPNTPRRSRKESDSSTGGNVRKRGSTIGTAGIAPITSSGGGTWAIEGIGSGRANSDTALLKSWGKGKEKGRGVLTTKSASPLSPAASTGSASMASKLTKSKSQSPKRSKSKSAAVAALTTPGSGNPLSPVKIWGKTKDKDGGEGEGAHSLNLKSPMLLDIESPSTPRTGGVVIYGHQNDRFSTSRRRPQAGKKMKR